MILIALLGALQGFTLFVLAKRTDRMRDLLGELALVRGAMRADDERLRLAGERVGIEYGCDTAEHMADEIEALRAEVAALRAVYVQGPKRKVDAERGEVGL